MQYGPTLEASHRAMALLRHLRLQGVDSVQLSSWEDGLVLRGQAVSPSARDAIREACRSVTGVRWIDDQMGEMPC